MGSEADERSVLNRVPPQSNDAERALLGSIMMHGDIGEVMADVTELVKPTSFYRKSHENIYSACLDLFNTGDAIDLVTVTQRMEADGNLEASGGVAYVDEIQDSMSSSANAKYYAVIVRNMAMRRYLILQGVKISQMANDYETEIEEVISTAEQAVMEIRRPEARKQLVTMKESATSAFKHVQAMYDNPDSIIGLSTGFKRLDKRIGGMRNGQYIVIGGRPGMGKSAFIQNIIYNAGVCAGDGVALFTLESSDEAFTIRMLSQSSQIDFQRLKSGHVEDSEFPALVKATGKMTGSPIMIDTTGNISASQMRTRLRQIQRSFDIKLIVVDYLQLMSADGKSQNRVDTMTNISREVKAIAQDYNCPLIAVSQLSRNVESRPDKRPQLSDLRESGAIEQDADIVMFMYREGYYDNNKDPKKTEVIIAKHKDGPVGTQTFEFNFECMTFVEDLF